MLHVYPGRSPRSPEMMQAQFGVRNFIEKSMAQLWRKVLIAQIEARPYRVPDRARVHARTVFGEHDERDNY